MPDAPHEFVQFVLDLTPTIARHGSEIVFCFDDVEQAYAAMCLLEQAIETEIIKRREESSEEEEIA